MLSVINFPTIFSLLVGSVDVITKAGKNGFDDPALGVMTAFEVTRVVAVTLIISYLYTKNYKFAAYSISLIPVILLVPVFYYLAKNYQRKTNLDE